MNLVLAHMIEWFSANKLVLNLENTNMLKFVINNLPYCALSIGHKDKCIEEAVHLIGRITLIKLFLSAACYMVRQMYYVCNNDTLRSIYCAYFHSIASYGIIFGGKFLQQ